MKLICQKCQCELRPVENGVRVIEMAGDPPKPYKIWHADLWGCRGCGLRVVNGFGHEPIARNWQANFEDILEKERTYPGTIIYNYERPQINLDDPGLALVPEAHEKEAANG